MWSLGLKRKLKVALKGYRKKLRSTYDRWVHGFTRDHLRSLLERMGIGPGDVVLVHSSFDRFEGFTGQATDVIEVLQEVVGPTGTLLMPTMPFTGTAVEYAAEGHVFDVRRTPSRMGLITEWFRRWPGAVRSVHPTHPVAAWGARAAELTAGHHRATTPCGPGSPWHRLLEVKGKILMLGTDLRSATFGHVSEVDLEKEFPFSIFTAETFTLTSRDRHGDLVETKTRLFNPAMSGRRRLDRVIPVLRERGVWKEDRVGRLNVLLLTAEDLTDAIHTLAGQKIYCYDKPEEPRR